MSDQPKIPRAKILRAKILREDEVIAPDPLERVRGEAANLPNDADDTSDAGRPTSDHANVGWRAMRVFKP